MTKIEWLKKSLLEAGYRKTESNLEQFTLFYRTGEGAVHGILLVELDDTSGLTAEQMLHIRQQVYQLLERMGERPALLTLAAGSQAGRFRDMPSRIPLCWLWDTESGRVMIYENQPGSFFGLERLLEGSLDAEAFEKAAAERGEEKNTGRNRTGRRDMGSRVFGYRNGRRLAVMNTAMVVLNILIFFVMELFGSTEDVEYMLNHGAAYAPWIYRYGEYYRLLTSMFLHFGIVHLGNNMLVLFFLGDNVERAVGSWKYLVIYILSGLAGSSLSCWHAISSGNNIVSAGASGAIFGIIGALFYIVAVNRGRLEDMTTRRLGIMLAVALYHGFTSSGVDNYAHLGGLATGILLALVLYRRQDS